MGRGIEVETGPFGLWQRQRSIQIISECKVCSEYIRRIQSRREIDRWTTLTSYFQLWIRITWYAWWAERHNCNWIISIIVHRFVIWWVGVFRMLCRLKFHFFPWKVIHFRGIEMRDCWMQMKNQCRTADTFDVGPVESENAKFTREKRNQIIFATESSISGVKREVSRERNERSAEWHTAHSNKIINIHFDWKWCRCTHKYCCIP